jgi:hypothetical protein
MRFSFWELVKRLFLHASPSSNSAKNPNRERAKDSTTGII